MSERKYEFTNECFIRQGRTLKRIKAVRDFGDVKAGDLGGFIQSEFNLHQYGECWVYNDGKVMDGASITAAATVRDNAIVMGDACVHGHAVIKDDACIGGDAQIEGGSIIKNDVYIGGYVHIRNGVVRNDVFLNLPILVNEANFCSVYDFISVGPVDGLYNYYFFYRDAKDVNKILYCKYDSIGNLNSLRKGMCSENKDEKDRTGYEIAALKALDSVIWYFEETSKKAESFRCQTN